MPLKVTVRRAPRSSAVRARPPWKRSWCRRYQAPLVVIFRVVSWRTWVEYSTCQAVASSVAPYLAAAGSEDGSVRATMPTTTAATISHRGGRRWVVEEACDPAAGAARSSTQREPSQNIDLAPFGNPADYESPVALRPRLATGVLFRGGRTHRSRQANAALQRSRSVRETPLLPHPPRSTGDRFPRDQHRPSGTTPESQPPPLSDLAGGMCNSCGKPIGDGICHGHERRSVVEPPVGGGRPANRTHVPFAPGIAETASPERFVARMTRSRLAVFGASEHHVASTGVTLRADWYWHAQYE